MDKVQQNRKKLLILAKNAGLYLAKIAVASCVEAWIEMVKLSVLQVVIVVASCVEAWIEIGVLMGRMN